MVEWIEQKDDRIHEKILQKDLLRIDGGLCVSTNIVSLIRAVGKMFSLCANCPKGKGDLFRLWIKIYIIRAHLYYT